MKDIQLIMGMPITIEIVDASATKYDIEKAFNYFREVDRQFSPYKSDSEVSRINSGKISEKEYSPQMCEVMQLSQETNKDTNGYFNVWHNGKLDPSGLVKGWAILNAANLLNRQGFKNFFVEAGGDIQTCGYNSQNQKWRVGIKNPFNQSEIVKVLELSGQGIATSGSYIRGQHIYNPFNDSPITEIVSITVLGPNVYEADRMATACFAMGKNGINFIENKEGLEGYMIDQNKIATQTSGFGKFAI